MNNSGISTQEPSSGVMRLWGRIPVVLRATILGSVVSSIGVYAWVYIATLVPVPWSVLIMGILLWV
jgi:hypothetical protein